MFMVAQKNTSRNNALSIKDMNYRTLQTNLNNGEKNRAILSRVPIDMARCRVAGHCNQRAEAAIRSSSSFLPTA